MFESFLHGLDCLMCGSAPIGLIMNVLQNKIVAVPRVVR